MEFSGQEISAKWPKNSSLMTRKFQTGHMAVWMEFFGQEISMNGQRIGGKFFWNEV